MQDSQFRYILEKYMLGQASEAEKSWLEHAYMQWNNDELIVPSSEILDEAIAENFKQVMIATMPKPISKLYLRVLSAAAIIVLVFVAWWLLPNSRQRQEIQIANGTVDISGATNRARLTLSDGSFVDLGNPSNDKVVDKGAGLKITNAKIGELVYEASGSETQTTTEGEKYNTIQTPAGGKYIVVLADGSKIWLNASTTLTFPTSFDNQAERHVRLQGEGYFEIAKMPQGKHFIPFVVETDQQQIKVLGTHFNVNSYHDEPFTTTTLLEGSVLVNESFRISPGEQARGKGKQIKVVNVNVQESLDWKTGEFNLASADFRSVMRKIARWYDVQIVYDENAPERVQNLGGWISRQKSLSSVLNLIQGTDKVHFKLEGRRVTVSK